MTKAEKVQKHRTVGISMGPSLELRAKARAEALGLKFSPYVTQCVEAELKGFAQIMRDDTLDLDSAIRRAREYMTQKTASIDFESDAEAVLARCGIAFQHLAQVGGQRIDYLLTLQGPERKVALECRHNVRQNYALALGQGLLLRSHPDIAAVVLLVPYLEGFDKAVRDQMEMGLDGLCAETRGRRTTRCSRRNAR